MNFTSLLKSCETQNKETKSETKNGCTMCKKTEIKTNNRAFYHKTERKKSPRPKKSKQKNRTQQKQLHHIPQKERQCKKYKKCKKKHTAKTVASLKYQLFHEKSQRVSIKPATQTAFQGYSANDFPNNSAQKLPNNLPRLQNIFPCNSPQKCTKTTSVDFNRTLQMLLVQQKA